MSKQIVAIDGPAGSGKSSVSKQLAREFGFGYLDTGAAYRALAWLVLQGLPSEDLNSSVSELINSACSVLVNFFSFPTGDFK